MKPSDDDTPLLITEAVIQAAVHFAMHTSLNETADLYASKHSMSKACYALMLSHKVLIEHLLLKKSSDVLGSGLGA